MKERPLHVVMLSDYESQGGAAVAATRLAQGLCRHHRLTRCVLYPDGQIHPWRTWPLIPGRPERKSRWSRFFTGQIAAPALAPEALLRQALAELRPDIVNVHNIHSGTFNGWGPDMIGVCAEFAPVVWTLHDMWSFTGRCAYAYECRKFVTGCDAWCPTPTEYPRLAPAEIRPAWRNRRQLLDSHPNVVAVCPSQWLAQEARAGLWSDHPLEVIPYDVPLDVFRPIERDAARQALGIDAEGPVLLMVAQDLTERRKGGPMVPTIFDHVRQRPLVVVTMGQGMPAIRDNNIRVLPQGWLNDLERQALVYNAADLVLHPAPVDNYPNALLEALACGTPAVGFAVGGVPEIILPGRTGWLAADVSAEAMGKALETALAELEKKSLRKSCRAWAERHGRGQVAKYCELFAALAPAGIHV